MHNKFIQLLSRSSLDIKHLDFSSVLFSLNNSNNFALNIVCLFVLLSYALKFSQNKYVIFGLIANSMKSAFDANEEYNRRYSFVQENREEEEDKEKILH